MGRLFIISLLLCAQTFAQGTKPIEPKGWVALPITEPAILAWTKPDINKDLKDAPNFSVQKFERTEKFEKFVKEKPLDKDSCRDLTDEGWNQTWCLRSKNIFVILSKNEDAESKKIKKTLKEWVLTHE